MKIFFCSPQRSEENPSMLHFTYEDSIRKLTENCLEQGQKEWKYNGNIIEGMNFLKVHCKHVWNYHNEISCIINVC
jgi:hypothetical protein